MAKGRQSRGRDEIFVPVRIVAGDEGEVRCWIEIDLPSGLRITAHGDVDLAAVAELARELSRC